MSDLTEAVRRLKELREDVERLKSGRNNEGEVRFLRAIADRSTVTDRVTTATGNPANFEWVGRYTRLTVSGGDTETISGGDIRTESHASVQGALDLDGTLTLDGKARTQSDDDRWDKTEWQTHYTWLTVSGGDTKTISGGDIRTESHASVQGALDLDGTLTLDGKART
jgi:murein endopeptidase